MLDNNIANATLITIQNFETAVNTVVSQPITAEVVTKPSASDNITKDTGKSKGEENAKFIALSDTKVSRKKQKQ